MEESVDGSVEERGREWRRDERQGVWNKRVEVENRNRFIVNEK